MGVIVDYTYPQWVEAYPQFSPEVSLAVSPVAFSTTVYPLAQQYCVNDGSGPVSSAAIQTVLLGLMCSHIAQLLFGDGKNPPSGIVGRITTASEGSVSVSADMPQASNPTQAWLNQTQFGAMFWAATSVYRRMVYRPGQSRVFNYRLPG